MVLFEPFESHVIENAGDDDLVFFGQYWRDPVRAPEAAAAGGTRCGFHDRPVFVFSTPPTPNGDLHLGHLSGPYLGADVYVRFQRMQRHSGLAPDRKRRLPGYVVDRARRDGASTRPRTAAHYRAEIAATLRRWTSRSTSTR